MYDFNIIVDVSGKGGGNYREMQLIKKWYICLCIPYILFVDKMNNKHRFKKNWILNKFFGWALCTEMWRGLFSFLPSVSPAPFIFTENAVIFSVAIDDKCIHTAKNCPLNKNENN